MSFERGLLNNSNLGAALEFQPPQFSGGKFDDNRGIRLYAIPQRNTENRSVQLADTNALRLLKEAARTEVMGAPLIEVDSSLDSVSLLGIADQAGEGSLRSQTKLILIDNQLASEIRRGIQKLKRSPSLR